MKAITVLATIAIGIVYFGSAGQTQNEHSQVSGEWFDQQPIASGLPVLEEGKQIFRFDTFGDEAFWTIPSSFIGDRGNEIWRSRRRRQPEDSTRCRLESRHGCPSREARRENQARPSQPGQTEDNAIGGGARPFASAKLMRSGRSRMSITRSPLTWRAARRRWISSLSDLEVRQESRCR
jgi:hypothetical protein